MQYDKSRIITPFNRETAEIGQRYYCADDQRTLEKRIHMGIAMTLRKVSNYSNDMYPFKITTYGLDFMFILPVDAVEVQK